MFVSVTSTKEESKSGVHKHVGLRVTFWKMTMVMVESYIAMTHVIDNCHIEEGHTDKN